MRGHGPTIHQAEADIVVLTTRTKLWPKRPADKSSQRQLAPTHPKLPPGKPRPPVDATEEHNPSLRSNLL